MVDRRVLFFGDSHVAGAGDRTGLGWVGRVVAASFQAGLPVTGYNLGVRGDTSLQVAARWRQEASPRLLPGADTRLVVWFGVNDTTAENDRPRVAAEQSCDALADILERAHTIGLPVFVVGPAPVDDVAQNRRIEALSAAFAYVCARSNAPFVSVVDGLLASSVWREHVAREDGAHPAAEGYEDRRTPASRGDRTALGERRMDQAPANLTPLLSFALADHDHIGKQTQAAQRPA